MPHIDIEILTPFAAKFMEGSTLTPAERSEVLRMAQGFACKDSAAAANVSPETIRARRKRIYRKLDMSGSGELISTLLALSLRMLARGDQPTQEMEQELDGLLMQVQGNVVYQQMAVAQENFDKLMARVNEMILDGIHKGATSSIITL